MPENNFLRPQPNRFGTASMFLHFLLFGLPVWLLIFSCKTNSDPFTDSDTYAYTAWDSSAQKIATGQLSLIFIDSTTIQGSWHLRKLTGAARGGPQNGTGALIGKRNGSQIFLNLQPQTVDNNIYLQGEFTGSKITGTWQWITFAGISDNGNFEAIKQETGG